jgi:single-stranded DNA-binding protein
MANIAIQGRLFEDATYRETASGKPVVTLKIPVYAGKKDGKYNPSQWWTVTAWESLAEQCRGYKKGTDVVIYGDLTYREWQGKNELQKVYEIRAAVIVEGREIPLGGQDDFVPEVEEDDVPL